jgi:hypothetical protein
MRTGGILVAALLTPALAMAQATPEANEAEAQKILTEGVQLMDSGHLPEAREKFARVRELLPDKANPYRLLGVVDFRLNRCKEAVEELETFLGKVGPNDRRVTEVVSMRDKCREELAPKQGELCVVSTPAGAEVFLDDDTGSSVGTTPYKNAQVPVGAHVVFLRKKGFKPESRGINLQKNDRLKMAFTLVKEEVVTRGPPPKPVYKKGWFWGVMAGAVAVAGGGVALGVYYGTRTTPFQTTLQPFPLALTIRLPIR